LPSFPKKQGFFPFPETQTGDESPLTAKIDDIPAKIAPEKNKLVTEKSSLFHTM
jgi:hypothetical protein